MDLQALANVGDFLGGLGVVISLVYLAVQIRANTTSQRSENYTRSLERIAVMQEMLATNHRLTELFNRGLSNTSDLTFTERTQFTWVLTELFGNLEYMYFQAQQATIPADLWARWKETLKWWLTFPGVLAWWAGRPTPFTTAFSGCVEQCIAQGYQPQNPGAWEKYMSFSKSVDQSISP